MTTPSASLSTLISSLLSDAAALETQVRSFTRFVEENMREKHAERPRDLKSEDRYPLTERVSKLVELAKQVDLGCDDKDRLVCSCEAVCGAYTRVSVFTATVNRVVLDIENAIHGENLMPGNYTLQSSEACAAYRAEVASTLDLNRRVGRSSRQLVSAVIPENLYVRDGESDDSECGDSDSECGNSDSECGNSDSECGNSDSECGDNRGESGSVSGHGNSGSVGDHDEGADEQAVDFRQGGGRATDAGESSGDVHPNVEAVGSQSVAPANDSDEVTPSVARQLREIEDTIRIINGPDASMQDMMRATDLLAGTKRPRDSSFVRVSGGLL